MLAFFELGFFIINPILVFLRKYFLFVCLLETGVDPNLFLATIFDVQLYC